jgi:hypothetical protein
LLQHNGYTIGYNAEAQFYGAASSNRPELTLPWATVVLDYVAAARNGPGPAALFP